MTGCEGGTSHDAAGRTPAPAALFQLRTFPYSRSSTIACNAMTSFQALLKQVLHLAGIAAPNGAGVCGRLS